MNKKTLIIAVSAITAAVLILTGVLVFSLKKAKPDTDTQQPENVTEQPQDQPDTQAGTDTQTQTGEETKKEETPNKEQTPATDSKAEDKDDTEKPVQGGTASKLPTSASAPKSYTEFSLTKGMSASQAYEYLNNFLSSKYSILVNKQNKVGSGYAPSNLRTVSGSDYKLESTAASALEKMMKAAKSAGHSDLVFYSGYRTYASQKNKYETRTQKYLNQGYSRADAEKKAGEYIAPPGSSEHHTGLAADVCSSGIVNKYGALVDEFDQTSQWRWLSNHCYEYGFIIRYRKNAESITGFSYEPWHFRYIGVEHATACSQLGITYEEYYSMLVSFRDAAKADAAKPASTKPSESNTNDTKAEDTKTEQTESKVENETETKPENTETEQGGVTEENTEQNQDESAEPSETSTESGE